MTVIRRTKGLKSYKNGRAKLLVDMSNGNVIIQKPDGVSSDPFISVAYDPTRTYKTDKKSQHLVDSSLPALPKAEASEKELAGNIEIISDCRPDSVSSCATLRVEDLEQNKNIPSNFNIQNILTNKETPLNVLNNPEILETCYGEEFNYGLFCEVTGCNEDVFASCHKCQTLQCWDHFNEDTSCFNHHRPIASTASCKTRFETNENFTKVTLIEHVENHKIPPEIDYHPTNLATPDDIVTKQTKLLPMSYADTDYILDDQTGWLIERLKETGTNDTLSSTETSFILDENTGQLIEKDRIDNCDKLGVVETTLGNKTFNKAQRVKGLPYMRRKIDKTENEVILVPKPPKTMKVIPCTHQSTVMKSSRTYLCGVISDDQREMIFKYFWDLETWEAKKAYLKNLVRIRPILRRRRNTENTKKAIGYDCYLPDENKEMVRVCKNFLLGTLDLNNETLSEWIKSLNEDFLLKSGCVNSSAQESQKDSANIPLKSASVKEWLDLLPKVPSHYCRSKSNRMYVESTFLSKSHMFRTYEKWCIENSKPMAHRKLFCLALKKERVSIFKPRKDQCDVCTAFKENNVTTEEYQTHQEMKEEAYNAKREALTMCSSEVFVFSADTQSVLLCPKLLVSEQYYKQKLQLHNYTIYCNNNKDVHLYVWHEGHGDVTSNEFTTCLLDFLELQTSLGYKKFVMFSDGCGYQNRNKVLASALNDFAKVKGIEIEQRFLEKGHTMMEADSVHSTLEKLFKPPIFLPSDYLNLMAQARPSNPYVIHHLDHGFFKNYAKTCRLDSLRPGKKTGDPVVTNIRALLYKNGEIFYKLRHPEDWNKLSQRLLQNKTSLTSLYKTQRKIEKSKFLSLQSLKKYIHLDNHQFYDSLLH